MSLYYLGVDVGSCSVRCGLFMCLNGSSLKFIRKHEIKIQVFNEEENIYEQSSENIWDSICKATQKVISESEINPSLINGIAFDGTCSLVALDKNEKPLSVSKLNINDRNIIMWMDLRANLEADAINNLPLVNLRYFGGKISVEMQPPKLMWLKKHIPNFMTNVGFLFDLPDYLVYRATGNKIRSLCSVTCKWAFDAENRCWDKSFWKSCNLEELCQNDFIIIGNEFCLPGELINGGLSENAAYALGLKAHIQVPASIIDAYAGVLGALTTHKQLVTIAGTSACHMIVTPEPVYIRGIWGPYKDVLIKGSYVLEAGQISVGNLLDRILEFSKEKMSHQDVVSELLKMIGKEYLESKNIINLPNDQWYQINVTTKNIHVNPDFGGNRNPRSDSEIRGSIIGLMIDSSMVYIAKLYLSVIHGIVYGFKEILDLLLVNNIEIDSIVLCGGLSNNLIFPRVLADVSGLPIILSQDEDLVLLGVAKLNLHNDINLYERNNCVDYIKINPDICLTEFHKEKFLAYKKIIDLQEELKELMSK